MFFTAFGNNAKKTIIGVVLGLIVIGLRAQGSDIQQNPAGVIVPARQANDLVQTGLRYEHAEGVDRDYSKAHDSYCLAARLDIPEAFMRLGWMYANGRGVPRNDSVANSLFRKAAALGNEMGSRLAEIISGDREEYPTCISAKTPINIVQQITPVNKLKELPRLPLISQEISFSQLTLLDKAKFAGSLSQLAKEFKLDPRLVFAIMRAESNFDPLARSSKGAQGLMQLIPETAERFAVKDITDPIENIRGGMAYLRWLLSFFKGNVVLSLAAYNAGEKTVEKFGGVPPYVETMAYVQRIRSTYPHDFHAYDERAAQFRSNRKNL
jgi:Transglycosylase SLT domain/Sel1 repeat